MAEPSATTDVHPDIVAWAALQTGRDSVARLESAAWGFSKPTAIATLASGERRVIQLFDRVEDAARSEEAATLLLRAGIPTPRVVRTESWGSFALVVTEHIAGEVAASAIGTSRGVPMAEAMARLYASARTTAGVAQDAGPWTDAGHLLAAVEAWSGSAVVVEEAVADQVREAAAVVAASDWVPTLSHGDFVPANALMETSQITALLDTADVAWRHPLVDAAWWALIVRHHHPAEADRLTSAFIGASSFTVMPPGDILARIALLRCAELAHGDSGPRNIADLTSSAALWCRDRG